MIARLATRFGITDTDEAEQSSEGEDCVEIHTDLFNKKGGTGT